MLPPDLEDRSPEPEEDDFRLPELRNLSLSSDGTIDSLLSSLDENPTPPGSPTPRPAVEVVDSTTSAGSPPLRAFEPEEKPALVTATLPHLTVTSGTPTRERVPPTPSALRLDGVLPKSSPQTPSFAARRAEKGPVPKTVLQSLKATSGIGLGVVAESPGATPDPAHEDHLSTSSDYFGPFLPDSSRSSVTTPSTEFRSGFRFGPPSLGLPSSACSSPALSAPPSPHVVRSSAFSWDVLRPRTPLTPSHVPGAPAIGAGGPSFEWFSFSPPSSPVSPNMRPVIEGN
ncbi:hypothetical protein JCM10908_000718 [Rhodotorula pacifica]|uniref:uncharacterized protein n=1 Tax=Rhodotorula pacifica TaxID=1495444 RepID=UPI00318052F2